MSKVDDLVKDFLAQKKIAVVGVSDKRETGCNAGYKRFKEAGYAVYAVNPRITTFKGAPCYPDLKSIPRQAGCRVHSGQVPKSRTRSCSSA